MRISTLLPILLATLASTATAQSQGADESKIKELIAQHAVASERRDLRALVELYRSDAEIIFSDGSRAVGHGAIEDAYRPSVESPAAKSGRHHIHPPESVRIRFLTSDIALVEVESHSLGGIDSQGAPLPISKSVLVTLWAKNDGRWTVVYQRSAGAPPQ